MPESPSLIDLITSSPNKGNIQLTNIKYGKPYEVYIGRANKYLNLPHSIFANPFKLERERDRQDCILKYLEYAETNQEIIDNLYTLTDKTLGCYCVPRFCHGNVLIYLYDKYVGIQ